MGLHCSSPNGLWSWQWCRCRCGLLGRRVCARPRPGQHRREGASGSTGWRTAGENSQDTSTGPSALPTRSGEPGQESSRSWCPGPRAQLSRSEHPLSWDLSEGFCRTPSLFSSAHCWTLLSSLFPRPKAAHGTGRAWLCNSRAAELYSKLVDGLVMFLQFTTISEATWEILTHRVSSGARRLAQANPGDTCWAMLAASPSIPSTQARGNFLPGTAPHTKPLADWCH